MRRAAAILAVFVTMTLTGTELRAQAINAPLDSGRVREAIKAGAARKETIGAQFETRHFLRTTGFVVFVQGPYDRIATAAGIAAKNYSAFTEDSVSGKLATPVFVVTATPWKPIFANQKWSITPLATRIVLVPKASSDHAVQPTTMETFPADWSNAVGGQFHGQGAVAYFPVDQLPPDDFDIVIVTDAQEYRIAIGKDDRKGIH